MEQIAAWQRSVFKDPSLEGTVNHIEEEFGEALDALNVLVARQNGALVDVDAALKAFDEFADIVHLYVQLGACIGLEPKDIEWSVLRKLRENTERKWQAPDEYGVVRHEPEQMDLEKHLEGIANAEEDQA